MPHMNYELFFYTLLGLNIALVAFSAGKGVERTRSRFGRNNDED